MKKGLLVLGILLVLSGPMIFITGITYTLMLPNIYQSTVRIIVSDTGRNIDCPAPCPHCSAENPRFLPTQFQIIQSAPILYEVINRLNLQAEWGRDGEKLPRNVALKILQHSVTVFQQRDTSIICISVKRDNPSQAAMIANEIAVTYRDSRLDLLNRQMRAEHARLEEPLQVPRKPVELVDVAEPDHRPVSPNLFMNAMLLLGVGAVPTIAGIALIVVSAMRKPSDPDV